MKTIVCHDTRPFRRSLSGKGIDRYQGLMDASGPAVAAAQMAAFRDWEQCTGQRFAYLKTIRPPTLVVNGVCDEMIPVANAYRLAENLPNAVLLTYPDAGHGSFSNFTSPSRDRRLHFSRPTRHLRRTEPSSLESGHRLPYSVNT